MRSKVPIPPLLPVPPPEFQTVSETNAPPGPVVDKVVPPTWVMFVLSDGKSIAVLNASVSPLALKNDWPWAAICLKICSAAETGEPPPHEQLNCLHRLSLAIRLSKSTHGLGFGAS